MTPAGVISLINRLRVDLSDEKRAQADIETALTGAGIVFEREKHLAPGDIIDFLIDGGIGIEVKLRGQPKRAIYRQLERYAAHDAVAALVLVSNVSMGLPPDIGGKPVYYASLSRGWL